MVVDAVYVLGGEHLGSATQPLRDLSPGHDDDLSAGRLLFHGEAAVGSVYGDEAGHEDGKAGCFGEQAAGALGLVAAVPNVRNPLAVTMKVFPPTQMLALGWFLALTV